MLRQPWSDYEWTESVGSPDAVCGCDHQTYPSECDANAHGVSAWYDGACH